jgi:hypothetical protein
MPLTYIHGGYKNQRLTRTSKYSSSDLYREWKKIWISHQTVTGDSRIWFQVSIKISSLVEGLPSIITLFPHLWQKCCFYPVHFFCLSIHHKSLYMPLLYDILYVNSLKLCMHAYYHIRICISLPGAVVVVIVW